MEFRIADTFTDSLARLAGQEQLPPGLERSNRQPADPPDVLEIWLLSD